VIYDINSLKDPFIRGHHFQGHHGKIKERLQKEKVHTEYTEAMKDVKESAKKDKRKFINDLAKDCSLVAKNNNDEYDYDYDDYDYDYDYDYEDTLCYS